MATLAPLLSAAPEVQIHVACAMISVCLAPIILMRQRRDRLHKGLGYIWIIAMAGTAISSFWLHGMRMIGPFSPIHILSAITLVQLFRGLRFALRREVNAHRTTMRAVAYYALVAAGAFTFSPGRLISESAFPNAPIIGFIIALSIGAALMWHWRRSSGHA